MGNKSATSGTLINLNYLRVLRATCCNGGWWRLLVVTTVVVSIVLAKALDRGIETNGRKGSFHPVPFKSILFRLIQSIVTLNYVENSYVLLHITLILEEPQIIKWIKKIIYYNKYTFIYMLNSVLYAMHLIIFFRI